MFLKSFTLLRKTCKSYIITQRYFSSGKIANDAIKLSDNCVQKLKQLCEGDKSFLRLCVESGGCSGFQYKFNLDDKVGEDDRIFKRDGVQVVVDETSLEYIMGSTIDYQTELIRSAFRVVQNPNADVGCSCGASFSIKIE